MTTVKKDLIVAPPMAQSPDRNISMREIDNGYVVNLTADGMGPSVRQELAFTSVNKTTSLRKALRTIAAFFDADTAETE